MPSGDIPLADYPRGGFHGQVPASFPRRLVITAKAAEATCTSKAAVSQMGTADPKLEQQLFVKLPNMKGEELKSVPSQGNSQQSKADIQT